MMFMYSVTVSTVSVAGTPNNVALEISSRICSMRKSFLGSRHFINNLRTAVRRPSICTFKVVYAITLDYFAEYLFSR
jgi:hypothetical protein